MTEEEKNEAVEVVANAHGMATEEFLTSVNKIRDAVLNTWEQIKKAIEPLIKYLSSLFKRVKKTKCYGEAPRIILLKSQVMDNKPMMVRIRNRL